VLYLHNFYDIDINSKLNNEKLYNFNSFPNIIRTIKSRWVRWAGRVERMEAKYVSRNFWYDNLNERLNIFVASCSENHYR
jgi:hypothetical protein